jgi:hypothetical protein
MLFQMCGVFAEFERAIISERVRAGLERVRANGPAKGKKAIETALKYRSSACQARTADAGRGNGPAEDRAQPRDRYQLGAATRRGGVTRRISGYAGG